MELLECRHLALDLVLVHREFPSHCLHHLFSFSLKLHLLNQLFFSLCLCLFPFPCPVSLSLCLSLFSFFLLSLLFLPWSQMQKNMSARLLPESPEKRNFHDLNHEPNSSNSQIKTLSFLQPFLHTISSTVQLQLPFLCHLLVSKIQILVVHLVQGLSVTDQ